MRGCMADADAPADAATPPPVPAEDKPMPGAVQGEATDVVPDTLPPSPSVQAGTGDPEFRVGAPAPDKKRRQRRISNLKGDKEKELRRALAR